MSYEQQNWVTGNRITAEKLNHMEEGISSANSGGGTPLIVKFTGETETLEFEAIGEVTYDLVDASPQDAFDALQSGRGLQLEKEGARVFPTGYVLNDHINFASGIDPLDVLPSGSGRLGTARSGGGGA